VMSVVFVSDDPSVPSRKAQRQDESLAMLANCWLVLNLSDCGSFAGMEVQAQPSKIPTRTRDTAPWVHSLAWVCQIGYHTHTRGTCLSGTVGLPVPVLNPRPIWTFCRMYLVDICVAQLWHCSPVLNPSLNWNLTGSPVQGSKVGWTEPELRFSGAIYVWTTTK
jgi:hypothetical protein